MGNHRRLLTVVVNGSSFPVNVDEDSFISHWLQEFDLLVINSNIPKVML